MPIRNPFGRRSGAAPAQDENVGDSNGPRQAAEPLGFERVDTVGSKAASLSTWSSRNNDTGAYKLSVVNDSGVYLPPSPTEDSAEKSPWSPRRLLSTSSRASSDAPASTGDIEPFCISRESFDSYRRSFDISARAPVRHELPPRQSLDSARLPRFPHGDRPPRQEPATEEEDFEDVGLDEAGSQPQQQQGNPGGRRKGIFSMFSEGRDSGGGSPAVSRFLPGRLRNQSGQGAELRSMERPSESRLRDGEA